MVKFGLAIMVFLMLFTARPAKAQGNLGFGFVLGSPTALSMKYWLSRNDRALDFALGVDTRRRCYTRDGDRFCRDWNEEYDNVHFHADYLFHHFFRGPEKFAFYYGPGMAFEMYDRYYDNDGDFSAGPRAEFGILWIPRAVPLDVFFEIAPTFYVLGYSDFDINGGLGVRFWF